MLRARLYWNLHKKCWSVQDCKTGRVVRHVTAFTLADAKFVVRPAGQAKVRREGKKNVHAFAVGDASLRNGLAGLDARDVTYNPYVNDTFVYKDTGEPATEAHVITVWTNTDGKPVVKASNLGHSN